MLFVVSIILLISSAILITSLFQLKNKISYLLSLFLICYSLNIVIAEISGFFGLLSSEYFFLLLQLLILSVILLFWIKKGKPSLLGPLSIASLKTLCSDFWKNIKQNPITTLFLICVLVGYITLSWLIIRVPPNNADSMHTHLARVMYWLQQGSFKQLTSFSVFAKIYPFDNNLNVLWTILFSHSDKYVGFVQYFSTLFCAVAIFGLVRLLKGSRRTALIISLIWMTFPENVFQSTTTQNDMIISALFCSCIYLFFLFFRSKEKYVLFLSALALGLSFGTKETTFMLGLGIVVMLAIFIGKDKKNLRPIFQWTLTGVISFIILGSFPYINNWVNYGNPLGPSDHVTGDSFGNYTIGEKLKYNTPRLAMQFFSFDSLPTHLAENGVELRGKIFSLIFSTMNIPLDSTNALKDTSGSEKFFYNLEPSWNEDMAWFGPASFLLIIPGIICGFIYVIKKKDKEALILLVFCLTFFVFEVILRPGWDPYQGRYFLITTALAVPLAAPIIHRRIISVIYTTLLYVIAVITFLFAITSNQLKPILGIKMFEEEYVRVEKTYVPKNFIQSNAANFYMDIVSTFWTNLPFYQSINDFDDVQLRTMTNRAGHEEIVRRVEDYVPRDATMGVILGGGTYDYVFFGSRLERKLVPINPIPLLYDKTWIDANGLEFVLISNQGRVTEIPGYFELVTAVDDWALYSVSSK